MRYPQPDIGFIIARSSYSHLLDNPTKIQLRVPAPVAVAYSTAPIIKERLSGSAPSSLHQFCPSAAQTLPQPSANTIPSTPVPSRLRPSKDNSNNGKYYTIRSRNLRYRARKRLESVSHVRAASCGKGSMKNKPKDPAQASLLCRRSIQKPRCTHLELSK